MTFEIKIRNSKKELFKKSKILYFSDLLIISSPNPYKFLFLFPVQKYRGHG